MKINQENIQPNHKIILITGASTGIGKSIATYLHKHHFKVIGTSRSPKKYTDTPYELVPLEITSQKSINDCVKDVISKYKKIDILINNAGAGITGPIEELKKEAILYNFELNYHGPIALSQAVIPYMRKNKEGKIINITSIAGYMGLPYRGIYSASKAALITTTEAWRMELKSQGIEMLHIAPGDFATNIANGRYHAKIKENSPYKKAYQKTLDLMDTHVDKGDDPILMAQIVREIIENPKPKPSYNVGAFTQRFSRVLKGILPPRIFEKLLMNHYQI